MSTSLKLKPPERLKPPGLWWHHQEARYRYRQGLTLSRQGAYGAAIAKFSRALCHHPQPTAILVARGLIHLQQGDLPTALADLDRAIALDPTHSKAYGNRGLIRAQLGDEAGALDDWQTALVHRPGYAEARYNRGLLFANQKNYAIALTEFDQALDANPNLAEAYLHRGNVRSEMGDRDGATKDWQLALLNDLSLDAAKHRLLALHRESQDHRITQRLQHALNDHNHSLTLHIERQGPQLNLYIHRARGIAINYQKLSQVLQTELIRLDLGWVERFHIIGRMGDSGLADWDRVYRLYENQPCPPAHWRLALITTFLLFPPFGIPALLYASQINTLYRKGHYQAAISASKTVRWIYWISVWIAGLIAAVVVSYGIWLLLKNNMAPTKASPLPTTTSELIPLLFPETSAPPRNQSF